MGRIFGNCKEAIDEIERDIMEMGIKVHPHTMQNKVVKDNDDFSTMELQNYTFSILDTSDKDTIISNRKWCLAEFIERIDAVSNNPGIAWTLREDVWKEFLNNEGEFDYTYGERLNGEEQLANVIIELRKNPDTRQAIIHVHYPSDSWDIAKNRIPCSMYYQLMVRRGKLDIIYNMRSSDFDTHFKNDIWLADELRNYIAEKIKVPRGLFHMNVGSLHRYKNYTKKHVF
jgi:thymidylate synthase